MSSRVTDTVEQERAAAKAAQDCSICLKKIPVGEKKATLNPNAKRWPCMAGVVCGCVRCVNKISQTDRTARGVAMGGNPSAGVRIRIANAADVVNNNGTFAEFRQAWFG